MSSIEHDLKPHPCTKCYSEVVVVSLSDVYKAILIFFWSCLFGGVLDTLPSVVTWYGLACNLQCRLLAKQGWVGGGGGGGGNTGVKNNKLFQQFTPAHLFNYVT